MEHQSIVVPKLDWLIGGSRIGLDYNRYTGSCGTDPQRGCLGEKIFNYSIEIVKDDSEERIRAAAYEGIYCAAACDGEDIAQQFFPCTQEALEDVRQWIEQKQAEIMG